MDVQATNRRRRWLVSKDAILRHVWLDLDCLETITASIGLLTVRRPLGAHAWDVGGQRSPPAEEMGIRVDMSTNAAKDAQSTSVHQPIVVVRKTQLKREVVIKGAAFALT
jgi:hypothetical protein